jgi:uncharacterized protein YceK
MKKIVILLLIAILMSGCIFKRGIGKHRGKKHLSLQDSKINLSAEMPITFHKT